MSSQTNILDVLSIRANLLEKIRSFFRDRSILEVETPILAHSPALELHIEPFKTDSLAVDDQPLYLISSPEYAMKRLLSMGTGSIYQITKVFRKEERSRLHNPEFTMIEWYLEGGDFTAILRDVEEFVSDILSFDTIEKLSYEEAFSRYAGINPYADSIGEIREKVLAMDVNFPESLGDCRADWLSFVLGDIVEPNLGVANPTIIYDYPTSQSALSKIRKGDMPIAERFELYIGGIELCNGYHELTDHEEHLVRFSRENEKRSAAGKKVFPVDEFFLEAVKKGLPQCSGVSFGFDRMVMIAAGVDSISHVIPFTIDKV